MQSIANIDPKIMKFADNLTTQERKALTDLKQNENITIKKADKGGSIVIMDTDYYRNHLVIEGHLQNNTYKEIQKDCDVKVMSRLKVLIENHKLCLRPKEIQYLTKFDWKTSNLYVLPKIHKCTSITDEIRSTADDVIVLPTPKDLKGRPIVAGCEAPTQRLSSLIEKLLTPIVTKVKTYVKDDWHFLRLLPSDLNFKETTLYSVDISSLYTNITHELGVEAITYWLNRYRDLVPTRFTNSFIIESLEFVLKNNNFIFDDTYYQQTDGTAMGTKLAPPYACLTVAYLEENKLFPIVLPKHFNQSQCQWIESHYKRYMDDGFIALLKSIDISTFLKCLNSLHPAISFTEEKATTTSINGKMTQTLNFLDINVMLNENDQVETDIFYKTTNAHDYLNYQSSHPEHTKRNVPYNLAKRIICFVSSPKTMESRLIELKKFLLKCNYPIHVIEKGIFNARLQGPAPQTKSTENTLPLITTHFANYEYSNIIHKTKFLLHHATSTRLKEIFQDCDFILSNRQPKNLLQQLTSAKFSTHKVPSNSLPFTSKCNDKRCKICEMYLQTDESFKLASGKVWHTKCNMTCQSKNIIYFLTCNRCDGKVSYIGKTTNLRLRTNQHISTCRTGNGSDKFDKHVNQCGNSELQEPFFKLYLMLKVKEEMLVTYESHFHKLGYDTMNR